MLADAINVTPLARQVLVVVGVALFASGCDDDLPHAPALCALEPEIIVPSVRPGAAECNILWNDTFLAIQDGVLYFQSSSGFCALDSTGFRLAASGEGPIRPGPREATDGTFVYGVSQSEMQAHLWREEPGGPREDLATIKQVDDRDDLYLLDVNRMAAAADHVDLIFRFTPELYRFDLATRASRLLFDSPTSFLDLLGIDIGVAYVDYAWGPSQRAQALARIDGSGTATGVFGDSLPQDATASVVKVVGDQAYVGVAMRYYEGQHIAVLTMPRDGLADELAFCMPTRATVEAIAVEGDTIYVRLTSGHIVRARQ